MSTTKTTATKKVAAGVVSFAMALSFVFGGAVAPAQAQTAAELQAQISSLLATIAALQAQLGTLSGGSATTGGTGYVFTRNLKQGDTGADVKELQKFLNRDAATMVAASGAGSAGNETMSFGPATKAAVIKFQNKYAASVLTPAGLTAGTGFFGSLSRAKANELNASTGGSTGGVVVPTGLTLNVALASDSPASSALVAGQAIANLAVFSFTNTSATEAKVTKLVLNRTGISADSTLSNVYLFDGATRISDAATVSTGKITVNNASGLFTVPAGTVKKISVRSDIASGTSGQLVGVALAEVESTVAVSGSLPVSGANHSVASATMGTVALTYTGPSNATDNPGTEVRVFEASAVVSTNAAKLEALTFENRGTSADGDLTNLRLYVDGVAVGSSVAQFTNDKATFDLSANPVRLETGTRIIKVMADIVKGSSETYDVQLRRAADARFVDVEFTQPILATTFPVAAGTANTIAAGTLSVSRAAASPSTNITVGATNVLLSSFEFRASGEDVKIEAATLDVDTTGSGSGYGLDNVKVFVNGAQVGSTKDVEETGTEFTFGSSFIAKAGVTTKVDIYGDAKTTTGTNLVSGSTIVMGVAIAAADTEGLNSGNSVTAVSNVDGFSRTVSASSLTATKFSGYSDQTIIAGTNNAKIGSFTLSAGSTEGINVNTIVVDISANNAATLTDLLLKDNATGAQLGTAKASPSTSNSFSVNIAIPMSGTKTIDVYANIKSGSNAGPIIATLDSTTGGTGATTANSTTTGSDLTLQQITIGSGTLTVTAGVSPDNAVVIAGTNNVKVGTFDFTTSYSSFTVQELKVKVPADAATSVSAVTLKWNGGEATQALTLSSGAQTYATATFTGLTFEIGANETAKKLDVYVNIPTIASGAGTGKAISVVLDADEGFKAIDAAGNSDTTLAAADLNSAATSGKGTMVVRKTVPTLSSVAISNTLTEGTIDLAKVKIAADAAGDIGWKKIVFAVKKTAALSIGSTTTLSVYDEGGNEIAGTFATTTAAATGSFAEGMDSLDNLTSGNLIFVATTEQVITAGSSQTYRLEGSVAGTASGSNYIEVSIPATSTSEATGTFSGIHTASGDSSESFVWTDRSVIGTPHSESTSDWANDYKVKGLNSALQLSNRSVSI